MNALILMYDARVNHSAIRVMYKDTFWKFPENRHKNKPKKANTATNGTLKSHILSSCPETYRK